MTDDPGAGGLDGLTVGDAATAVGVSVRTLHHWDELGLVRPSGRSRAGYRVYAAADLSRLRRVVAYRALGLPLARIAEVLDAAVADPAAPLRGQRALLVARIEELQAMVEVVDRLITTHEEGTLMGPDEQAATFGPHWRASWTAEAKERWGTTDAWTQSAERAAGRTPQDWQQVTAATAALERDLAAAARAGLDPGSDEAAALAERHRASIGVSYDCSPSMHVCLARMYTDDPRFTAHYDALHPGLATWLRSAIEAGAARHGVDPQAATWQ